jgi:hypothetical protein
MKKPKAAAAESRSRRFDDRECRADGDCGIEGVTASLQDFKTGFRGERVCAGDRRLWRSGVRDWHEKDDAERESNQSWLGERLNKDL